MKHFLRTFDGRQPPVLVAVMLTLVASATLTTGCKRENPMGLSDQQLQGINRQQEILRKAKGNWSKVSPADKDFLIKGTGSEEAAKQMVAHQGADGKAPAGQYGPPPGVK